MPTYAPESNVSRPETLPANSRGLTTQNSVWSFSNGSAFRAVATVTTTRVRSGESCRSFTVPKTMSLNFSSDLPASRPSAVRNETLIVGPSFDSVSQASHAPIATATSGMIQMAEKRRRVVVCETGGSCVGSVKEGSYRSAHFAVGPPPGGDSPGRDPQQSASALSRSQIDRVHTLAPLY